MKVLSGQPDKPLTPTLGRAYRTGAHECSISRSARLAPRPGAPRHAAPPRYRHMETMFLSRRVWCAVFVPWPEREPPGNRRKEACYETDGCNAWDRWRGDTHCCAWGSGGAGRQEYGGTKSLGPRRRNRHAEYDDRHLQTRHPEADQQWQGLRPQRGPVFRDAKLLWRPR